MGIFPWVSVAILHVRGFCFLSIPAHDGAGRISSVQASAEICSISLLYVLVLYGVGAFLQRTFGKIVFVRISPWPLTIGCLVVGVFLLMIRYDWYGKDARLKERI